MKFLCRVFTLLLCMLLISGCTGSASTDAMQPVQTLDTPAAVYRKALELFNQEQTYRLTLTIHKTTVLDENSFYEVTQLERIYNKSMQPVLYQTESICYDDYTIQINQWYQNNRLLYNLNDVAFEQDLSWDNFLASLIPGTLVNADLYQNIEGRIHSGIPTIGFSKPVSAEKWTALDGLEVSEGFALMQLDATGRPVKITYERTTSLPSGSTTLSALSQIEYDTQVSIPLPKVSGTPFSIKNQDALCLLEKISGLLLQSQIIQSKIHRSVSCEAGNLLHVQDTALSMQGSKDHLEATVSVETSMTNLNQTEQISFYQQTERFVDGKYTRHTSIPDRENDHAVVTADSMRTYCQNLLVGTLILPSYVTDITPTTQDSKILLHFSGSEALANAISEESNLTLYGDTNTLARLAESIHPDAVQCTVLLDRSTGLPISSELLCSTIYTIREVPYTLMTRIKQHYQFH